MNCWPFGTYLGWIWDGQLGLSLWVHDQRIINSSSISLVRIFLSVCLIFSFMVMLFLLIMVLCLVGYHMFLALVRDEMGDDGSFDVPRLIIVLKGYRCLLFQSNLTTWENIAWGHITYLKYLPENKGSPFNRGIIHNLCNSMSPNFIILSYLSAVLLFASMGNAVSPFGVAAIWPWWRDCLGSWWDPASSLYIEGLEKLRILIWMFLFQINSMHCHVVIQSALGVRIFNVLIQVVSWNEMCLRWLDVIVVVWGCCSDRRLS